MRHELERLGQLVAQVGASSAQQFGQVDQALRIARRGHRQPRRVDHDAARGAGQPQGPRSVGRADGRGRPAAGRLHRGVNYRKQTARSTGGSGLPDFTFDLPKGHVLHMDVKFPLASYLRYLDAGTDPERQAAPQGVPARRPDRVKELAGRNYADGGQPTVDYVLLFLPNEQLGGFIHEHDPGLLEDALRQQVVMCSPFTLFAFLGVIRQAFDNFMIEQTSDEILAPRRQVQPAVGQVHRRGRQGQAPIRQVPAEFDQLATTRGRQLERPLRHSRRCARSRRSPSTASCSPTRAPAGSRIRAEGAGPSTATWCDTRARIRLRPDHVSSRSSTRGHEGADEAPTGGHLHGERARRRRQRPASAGGFSDGVWVRGEIQGWSERGRHAYFTLAEDQVGDQGGHPRSRCSRPARAAAHAARPSTGCVLGDGMKVRIYGDLDYFAPTGRLSLKMGGLDPRFTLGDLAMQRDQVLRRLVAAGLVDANKGRRLTMIPLRIGVVTERGQRRVARLPPRARRERGGVPVGRSATCASRASAPWR